MDDPASRLLDVQVTRRLIQLELKEIDLESARPRGGGQPAALYFRVFVADGVLAIELWDSGRYFGERRVSAEGGAPLLARRLALASAELTRAAKEQREREDRRRRQKNAVRERPAESSLLLPASLRLSPAAHGAIVDDAELWLLGPRVSAALVFHQGARLDLGVGWQVGGARLEGRDAQLHWSEVTLAPAYGWQFGRSEIDLGLIAGIAAASLRDAPLAPDERGSVHTWSTRLAALFRFEQLVAADVRLSASTELGHLLRPIELGSPAGEQSLGGWWLGLNLGVELTVAGRDRRRR